MGGFLPPAERRSGALVALYAALSLLLLIVGDRLPQGWLRSAGAHLFAPLDRIVLVGDRLGAAWRESQSLHQRIARLELENARLRQTGVENETLREALGLRTQGAYPMIAAEVLAFSGAPVPVAATLSAGRDQGVEPGDPVVTGDGLLGRVGESYARLSRAVLLSDPTSVVACEVESTGVLGLLRSTTSPRPRLVLTEVPLSDTVRIGQRVLTSGLSQRFPRHLPVGRVVRVGRAPAGLTQEIEVEPGARLSTLRHAFVLDVPPREEGMP